MPPPAVPADDITDEHRVVIARTAPYARFFERLAKPYGNQPQVPKEGVYQNAAGAVQRRWAGVITARYEGIELEEIDDASLRRQPSIRLESAV